MMMEPLRQACNPRSTPRARYRKTSGRRRFPTIAGVGASLEKRNFRKSGMTAAQMPDGGRAAKTFGTAPLHEGRGMCMGDMEQAGRPANAATSPSPSPFRACFAEVLRPFEALPVRERFRKGSMKGFSSGLSRSARVFSMSSRRNFSIVYPLAMCVVSVRRSRSLKCVVGAGSPARHGVLSVILEDHFSF